MNKNGRIWQTFIRPLRYRVYRRLLLTYLAIVMVLVLLIGSVFGTFITRYAINKAVDYSSDMMSQRLYSLQMLWEEMGALSSSMSTNASIQRFLTLTSDDKIVRYQAIRELANYKVAYPFIRNISAINLRLNQQLSLLYYVDDRTLFSEYYSMNAASCLSRVLRAPGNIRPDLNVLTFIYPIQFFSAHANCGFVISIDQSHLHSVLRGEGNTAIDSDIFILDRSGRMVTRTGTSPLPNDPEQLPFIQDYLVSESGRGSFFETIDGVSHMVTYCSFPSQEWTVFSIQPAGPLRNRIMNSLLLIAGILAVLLLAVILVIALTARSVYQPIRTLVDEVTSADCSLPVDEIAAISSSLDSMRDRSDELQRRLHQATVRSLLLSAHHDLSAGSTFQLSPAYAVALVVPCVPLQDNATLTGTAAVIQQMLLDICDCDCLLIDNRLALLLSLKTTVLPDAALIVFDKYITRCRERDHLPVQVSISDLVLSPSSIHTAYDQAQQISQYSFFYPSEHLLTSSVLANVSQQPVAPELARKLLTAFCDEDEQTAQHVTAELLSRARLHQPAYCREIMNVMISSCITTLSGFLDGDACTTLLSQAGSLAEAQTFAQLEKEAHGCVAACCAAISANETNRSALHNQRIIQQVCEYVSNSYNDPDLSLQSAAAHVQLSPGYLGRLFKQVKGHSFSEHLTSCRLSAACELLTTTNLPIATIAEHVGMGNPSYFATLFRKAYGMSPSSYKDSVGGKS